MNFESIVRRGTTWAVAGAALVALVAAPARADEFSQRLNDYYKAIQSDKRSDVVLLPLLAKMQPAPEAVDAEIKAMLLPASSAGWSRVQEWAMAQPQRDLVEAVKKVTSEDNPRLAWAFGQPYGSDAADPDTVIAKMYTELGDPPALATADFLYLPAIDALFCLLHVEATRLQNEGKPFEAMETMFRCLMLARQIADREFLTEKLVGMTNMYNALTRLRDIAYVDSRAETPKLTAENIRDILRRLRDDRAALTVERIRLPRGDNLAAEQIISRVYDPRGGPNAERFAPTLARIASRGRPMRMFSESAKWEALRPLSGNDLAAREALGNVFNDWAKRWDLEWNDPILKLTPDYQKLDKTRFAMIDMVVGDVGRLFPVRRSIVTEVICTRTALAMYGQFLQHRAYPRDIAAVRPVFLQKIDWDPWDQNKPPKLTLEFFVPMRDRPGGPNEPPKPHEIEVFPDLPAPTAVRWPSFSVRLRDDTFVMYSTGPDGQRNGMRKATGMVEDEKGDYLAWPPVLSLLRQNLVESGRLK